MQSLYSSLGKHVEGSGGTGGYYYMDPDRAGITKIYKTHQEFLSMCKDSGKSEHAYGTNTTVWEQGQYTAYQVEQKLEIWNYMFGNYGTLSGEGNSEIVEIAKVNWDAHINGEQKDQMRLIVRVLYIGCMVKKEYKYQVLLQDIKFMQIVQMK